MIFCARAGQLAKGFIYLVMAVLAANLIWSGRGDPSGSRGAIHAVSEQPFGRILMLALVAGLACYIVARALDAFLDLEQRGHEVKGLLLRARSLIIALIYCGITAVAVKTLLGSAPQGQSHVTQDWTARALQTPFGSWSVTLIGLGVVAGGIFKIFRAYTRKFEKKLELDGLHERTRRWLTRLCIFGLTARGVVFIIIGGFLVQAGWQSDAEKARGLSGALQALREEPYGAWLFSIVAAGLAAYGVYCGVRAFYGRWGKR